MMDWITGILSSVFTGGATGIIGVVVQRYFDMQNKRLDLELFDKKSAHELAMRDKDAAIAASEAAARIRTTEVNADAQKDVADAGAFDTSLKVGNVNLANTSILTPAQNWLFVIADFVKGAVRPVLTIYLCVLVSMIYDLARRELVGEDITADQAVQILKQIVETILYVWITVTLWWFGTRNKGKQPGA